MRISLNMGSVQSTIKSICNRAAKIKRNIYEVYFNAIDQSVRAVSRRGYRALAVTAGMILTEAPTLIRAGVYTAIYRKNVQQYGIDLAKVDSTCRHVLLLHGAAGSWHYMRDLTNFLRKEKIQVSIIDLGGGEATQEKRSLVISKIQQIRGRYSQLNMTAPKIDIVAHSLGGYLGLAATILGGTIKDGELQEDETIMANPHVGKLITLAMPYNAKECAMLKKADKIDETFNIIAQYDALMGTKEQALSKKNSYVADAGHIGIVYSQEAIGELAKIVKQ